jgi:hypothetical protein
MDAFKGWLPRYFALSSDPEVLDLFLHLIFHLAMTMQLSLLLPLLFNRLK